MTASPTASHEPSTPESSQATGWSWSAFAFVVGLFATLVLGASIVGWHSRGVGSVVALVAIAAFLAISLSRPLTVARSDDSGEAFGLDEAFLVFALFLLPPVGVLATMVAGNTIGVLARRSTLEKTVTNIGINTIAISAAVAVFEALGGASGTHGRLVVAAIIAAILSQAICKFLVSTAFRLTAGIPYKNLIFEGLRFQGLSLAGTTSIGLVAGLASPSEWWAPLLTLTPLALLTVVLREHLQARADRDRLDGLLQTAIAAHASIETDDVLRSLEQSARTLLQCRRSWVSVRPPRPEERGVRLGTRDGSDLWLIVADRLGNDSFGESEDQVLQGVAAIAGSALDNAELVDQMRHQGLHDQLTDLPNQVLFDDRSRQAVQRAQRDRETVAVLAIDLDGFKKVNESLGHEIGNEVLIEVARRLSDAVREVDTLARMSGDHFNVLVPGAGSTDTVNVTAERLLDVLRRPFRCGGHEVFLTASIGIAIGPSHGLTASELLRNADSALHQAKLEGGDARRLYSPDMNEQALARLSRESELHAALHNNELFLVYQPQINLRSGATVGVEALVRWRHPVLGLVPPDDFIPIAEESGLIADLDAWVLRTACEQLREWDDLGLPPLHMGVNQSGRNFNDDRLVGHVIAALEHTGLTADRLEIEITERVALRGSAETMDVLDQLRRLGVRLAVDDFGTGYSSLAQLQQFSVDRLKIDRGFIRQITTAIGPAPLIAAFIGIARALDMEVIAEGVETAEQEAFLRRYDCDEAQGYLYSKPVSPNEIVGLLRRNRSLLVTAV